MAHKKIVTTDMGVAESRSTGYHDISSHVSQVQAVMSVRYMSVTYWPWHSFRAWFQNWDNENNWKNSPSLRAGDELSAS